MASFLGEIKRRKVFQVAAVYAVVAWLLVQIVATIEEPLGLPPWFDTGIIVLLAVCFPIAVILTWAFDLTPSGLGRTKPAASGDAEPPETIPARTGLAINLAVVGLLSVLLVLIGVFVFSPDESVPVVTEGDDQAATPVTATETPEALPNSVAVLLCDNLSPNPDNAYFAAGIHEEILNQLVKVESLNVIARTSVLQYADAPPPISRIAEELNVETVMECSVRFAGDAIMVTAQLIDPETDVHLWSDTYLGDLSDLSTVFAMQADIAMNIANALEAEFSLEEQASIESQSTESSEAYSLYLRALATRVGDASAMNNIDAAVTFLDRALALDPDFALAYGEKALRLAARGRLDPRSEQEREQVAQLSAERALSLDRTVAVAHAALGGLHAANARWMDAQLAYESAYRLNPKDTLILQSYGSFKRDVGDYEGAVRLLEMAANLDPLANRIQLGIAYRYVGNYDASRAAFLHSIDVDPANPHILANLAYTEIAAGRFDEGRRQLQLSEALGFDDFFALRYPQIAYAYAHIGRPEDAQRLFDELAALEARGLPVSDTAWTLANLAIGNIEEAFRRLQAMVDDQVGEYGFGEIKANQYSDPVLNQPRFQELRDRMAALE
jgi:TolB-like protein/Tfp pilus assembly protein PilF